VKQTGEMDDRGERLGQEREKEEMEMESFLFNWLSFSPSENTMHLGREPKTTQDFAQFRSTKLPDLQQFLTNDTSK